MIRDVFYYGEKPNVHPREQKAKNLQEAKQLSTTDTFWIINEYCIYDNFDWDFDFDFLPDEDVWAEHHNNIWPSVYQKDSGTWLCSKNLQAYNVHRIDVEPLKRKNIKNNYWKIFENIDELKFDFGWHHDPTDPPYIYVWGNKYVPGNKCSTIEYVVENATQKKYMDNDVVLLPNYNNWVIHEKIDDSTFDLTFRPNIDDPPYIYTWGNKYCPAEIKPTIEYVCENATERKYVNNNVLLLPDYNKWVIHENVDKSKFDFSWRPGPYEPPYIYVWGNRFTPAEQKPTIEYIVEGATEKKYINEVVALEPLWNCWNVCKSVVKESFDWEFRPSIHEPPYIYVWGNKYIPGEVEPTVEFIVLGATQRKYMPELIEVLPNWDNYIEHVPINKELTIKNGFDFSWRPHPNDPAFIYIWGNKHIAGEVQPTLEYVVPGATQRKYMPEIIEVLPEYDRWKILHPIDETSFDFSWRPHPNEPPYIYVFGNTQYPSTVMPTLEYHVPNATMRKYMDVVAKLKSQPDKFITYEDITGFDYSWVPDPHSPAYVYAWGNQWNKPEDKISVKYVVDNATEIKYMEQRVKKLPDRSNFVELLPVDEFDYSWEPNPNDPPYIYVFGNQWNSANDEPTLKYVVPNATEKKYVTDIVAKLKPNYENYVELIPVESFRYDWKPPLHDPPYIYVFGNKYNSAEVEPTLKYVVPNATEIKYMNDFVATTKPTSNWKNTEKIIEFDYSWRPHPNDKPLNYQFGTQWAKTHGPTYIMENATETKYIDFPVAIIGPNNNNWIIPNTFDTTHFDFSWHPDGTSPPYIYQFGTYVDDVHLNDGPSYVVPNHNDKVINMDIKTVYTDNIIYPKYYIETSLEDLISKHVNEIFWAVRSNINYDKFDFTWKPNKENLFVINTFGSKESETTQTYLVNGPLYQKGHKSIHFVESDTQLTTEYLSELFVKPDMFYIDKGNIESNERYLVLKELYPELQKTRFLNNWVDTINRCIKKSNTELCWILNSELDYSNFTFDYYPNPWQMKLVHVFGTQWNHWGTTFMVNRDTFSDDTKYIKVIEHLPNINIIKNKRAKNTNCLYDIVLIDYGNEHNLVDNLKEKTKRNITVVNYDTNLYKTFTNLFKDLPIKKDHYLFVVSSICNYDRFDFSYIPDPFSTDQLHVFPSDKQKYGDTFFINVNKLRVMFKDINRLDLLENINFNEHFRVSRIMCPNFIVNDDTHTELYQYEYKFPYASFVTIDNQNLFIRDDEPICMWHEDMKNIIVSSTGASRIVAPKEASNVVKNEVYDYPYIKTSNRLRQSKPLDIVFLSNGESCADENFEYLKLITRGSANRVVRVDGVIGRVQAYQACAKESETPWVFTVFAKLKVNKKFDWSWQPDRLQKPKHYIFYATNPLNQLEYGHQAMIAYNKKITLSNSGVGLDFTLDNEHEVVELNSGIAHFNTDPYSTWRTAFRECIKLRHSELQLDRERLNIWLSYSEGNYAQYCLDGAKHAVDYYEEVDGDVEKLRLSYEWNWCKTKFENCYK